MKKSKKAPPKPARKTPSARRKKPISFDVPPDALTSPSSGWVYRSGATPAPRLQPAVSMTDQTTARSLATVPRKLPATTESAKMSAKAAQQARGWFASAVNALAMPFELALMIVIGSAPNKRQT